MSSTGNAYNTFGSSFGFAGNAKKSRVKKKSTRRRTTKRRNGKHHK